MPNSPSTLKVKVVLHDNVSQGYPHVDAMERVAVNFEPPGSSGRLMQWLMRDGHSSYPIGIYLSFDSGSKNLDSASSELLVPKLENILGRIKMLNIEGFE
jgi:hypothetical protein